MQLLTRMRNSTQKQMSNDMYVYFKEMVCTPFNNIDVNPVSPEITVIAWVKREGMSVCRLKYLKLYIINNEM